MKKTLRVFKSCSRKELRVEPRIVKAQMGFRANMLFDWNHGGDIYLSPKARIYEIVDLSRSRRPKISITRSTQGVADLGTLPLTIFGLN